MPILNRTVRIEKKKNRYRFGDWNVVATTLGGMWEPFNLPLVGFGEHTFPDTDLDDEICRIDRMEFDWDWRNPYYFERQQLIGGFCLLGRKLGFSRI